MMFSRGSRPDKFQFGVGQSQPFASNVIEIYLHAGIDATSFALQDD